MIYVLFVYRQEADDDNDVATLVVVTEAWVESRLAIDDRYHRLGSGSITEIIDLGEAEGFQRTVVVDAVACSEELESEHDIVHAQEVSDISLDDLAH
jgi:hypothetical protein